MLATDRFRAVALAVLATLLASHPPAHAQCIDYRDALHYAGRITTGLPAYPREVAVDGDVGVLYKSVTVDDPEYGLYQTTFVYDVSIAGEAPRIGTVPYCFPPGGCCCWRLTSISAGHGILAGLHEDSLYVGDASDPSNISLSPIPMPDATVTAVGDGFVYVLGTPSPGARAVSMTDFVVVDVSDPGTPVEVGRATLNARGDEMVAAGSVAYVAGGPDGLHVVDASDGTNPQLVGTVALSHDVTYIDRRGTFVYAASAEMLTVIDVSSPLAPVVGGTLAVPALDLAAGDGYVVVGWSQFIYVVDVRDPDVPVIADVLTGGFGSGWGPGPFVEYVAVGASGDVFWLGTEFVSSSSYEASFFWTTLPTPGDPRIASVPAPALLEDVVIEGSLAYALDEGGVVRVIDLSSPLAPAFRGQIVTGGDPRAIAVQGGYAYVTDGTDGLYIVNASDPDAPVVAGLLPGPGLLDVAVQGEYAYVSTDVIGSADELLVVYVWIPFTPTVVGAVEVSAIQSVAVSWPYVYATTNGFPESRLHVINVWAPEVPIDVASCDIGYYLKDVIVDGSIVYAAGYLGVLPIDVSSPLTPTPLDPVDVEPGFHFSRWTLQGATLYGTGGAYGHGALAAIDVTNPSAISLLGEVAWNDDDVRAIASSPDHLYTVGSTVSVVAGHCDATTAVGPSGRPSVPPPILVVRPSPVRSLAAVRFLGVPEDGSHHPVGQILDVQGRVVGEVGLYPDGPGYTGTWDARYVANGVYFLRVPSATGAVSRRIVRLD